jgi:hypothetical protein
MGEFLPTVLEFQDLKMTVVRRGLKLDFRQSFLQKCRFSFLQCAEVAQLVEHSPEKAGVDSSILSLGTILPRTYKLPSLFPLPTNCPKLPVAHLTAQFFPVV